MASAAILCRSLFTITASVLLLNLCGVGVHVPQQGAHSSLSARCSHFMPWLETCASVATLYCSYVDDGCFKNVNVIHPTNVCERVDSVIMYALLECTSIVTSDVDDFVMCISIHLECASMRIRNMCPKKEPTTHAGQNS